jgi:hypothetical protein
VKKLFGQLPAADGPIFQECPHTLQIEPERRRSLPEIWLKPSRRVGSLMECLFGCDGRHRIENLNAEASSKAGALPGEAIPTNQGVVFERTPPVGCDGCGSFVTGWLGTGACPPRIGPSLMALRNFLVPGRLTLLQIA